MWRDIYSAQIAAVEFGISDDSPFDATLEAAAIGSLTYAKMSGTINRVARTAQSIRSDTHDSYSLVINMGDAPIGGTYRNHDLELAVGGAFLDASEPQDVIGRGHNRWGHLSLPRKLLDDRFAGIEGSQGIAIAPDHAALQLMRNYLQIVDATALPAVPALSDHVATTIVDLVGLATGAKGDEAELAGLRGVRAARLQSILRQVRGNYRNPALSAQLVGLQLGLSARYVQDLLAATGIGFSERILELRLQDAKEMLGSPRCLDKRIGEIAYDVGFGDISYFNRCFRRRFGCSPSAAR